MFDKGERRSACDEKDASVHSAIAVSHR